MNCQEAIELLPWRLNGTLAPEELRQVDEHLASCPTCRAAQADNRLAWEIFAQHVPADLLVAHAWGELPAGADADFVVAHLAECPRCAEELELVRASRRLAEADDVPLLQPRRPPAVTSAPAPRRLRAWQAAALAAGLAGVVAAGGWRLSFERAQDLSRQLAARPAAAPAPAAKPERAAETLARLAAIESENQRLAASLRQMEEKVSAAQGQVARLEKAPEPKAWSNTAIIDASTDVLRGQAASASTVVTFGSGALATLLLRPKGNDTAGEHVLALTDAHGRHLWRLEKVRLDPEAFTYNVTLSRLAPGEYAIELDPGTAAAERFPLTVR